LHDPMGKGYHGGSSGIYCHCLVLYTSQIDLWHVPHGLGDHALLNHVSDGENKENEADPSTPRPVADKVVDSMF
jgi:hypothetical protein